MEVDMALSKKTTILFPPRLFDYLSSRAKQDGKSLGQLVREACEKQYGTVSEHHRLQAVDELEALQLPVASTKQMKRESVPAPDQILP